jgi:hypothetical protein
MRFAIDEPFNSEIPQGSQDWARGESGGDLAAEGVNLSHNNGKDSKMNLLKSRMSSTPNSHRGFIQTLRNL